MNGRPSIEERYTKGQDVINYVTYASSSGLGDDEVLQHKLLGTTETAHVTLHPDGTVNLRVTRVDSYIRHAIRTGLEGYSPPASERVKRFVDKVIAHV